MNTLAQHSAVYQLGIEMLNNDKVKQTQDKLDPKNIEIPSEWESYPGQNHGLTTKYILLNIPGTLYGYWHHDVDTTDIANWKDLPKEINFNHPCVLTISKRKDVSFLHNCWAMQTPD